MGMSLSLAGAMMLGGGGGATVTNPIHILLGSSLLALWDAEETSRITESGGLVSSWKDVVANYDATASLAARPTYSATSFNSRPGVTFDGSANVLTYAGVGTFPTGSSPVEMWLLCDQLTAAADTGEKVQFIYGNASATGSRAIRRSVVTGTNRFRGNTGDGVSSSQAANTSADYSGRHLARYVISASEHRADIDGNAGTPVAFSTANTGTTRTRIGANSADTPGAFANFIANALLITLPLSSGQASDLTALLKARGGIA